MLGRDVTTVVDAYIDKDELYERVMGYIGSIKTINECEYGYILNVPSVWIVGCQCAVMREFYVVKHTRNDCPYYSWVQGKLRLYRDDPKLVYVKSFVTTYFLCANRNLEQFAHGHMDDYGRIYVDSEIKIQLTC